MYTVKGVTSHYARDGVYTRCSIYRDGKKICTYTNYGDGAEAEVQFVSPEEQRIAMEFVKTYARTQENFVKYDASSAWDIYVEDLCNDYDQAKIDRKLLKTLQSETCFRLKSQKYKDGVWSVFKKPFTPEMHDMLRRKYGDDLGEILNVTKSVQA
jgi:hypothetical protein